MHSLEYCLFALYAGIEKGVRTRWQWADDVEAITALMEVTFSRRRMEGVEYRLFQLHVALREGVGTRKEWADEVSAIMTLMEASIPPQFEEPRLARFICDLFHCHYDRAVYPGGIEPAGDL